MTVHTPHAGRVEDLPRKLRRNAWRASQAVARAALRPTAPLRVLPDVLLVGAQRSGTTSLWRMLAQHEGFLGPRLTKGVHWWDARPERSRGWYRSHFPLRVDVERVAARTGYRPVVAEASPYYLFHPTVPRRVARDLVGVRVLVVLRDPVSRAWSHYHHEVAKGFEDRPFRVALAEEDAALAAGDARLRADDRAVDYAHMHHGYTWRGRYAEQLERWFEAVGRQRVHVLWSGDLRDAPEATMRGVTDFLGLPAATFEAERANVRHNPPLDADLRAELSAGFEPWDARLADLLGRTPPWRGGST